MSKATGLNGLRLTVQAIMQMLRKKADADKVVSSVNGQTGDVTVEVPALPDNIVQSVNGAGPDENGNVQVQVGVTSWNELKDRPFGEETGRGVLYDKTVTDDSYNQYWDDNAPFAFVEGGAYEVTVSNRSDDGEDITVEFVAASNADGFVGYEDENLTIRTKSADGVNALICILTGVRQKTYNLKIIGPGTFVKQIDSKFIPGTLKVVITPNSNMSAGTASASAQEIAKAIDEGRGAYAVINAGESCMVFHPSIYATAGVVAFYSTAVQGNTLQSISIVMQDGYNCEITNVQHELT